MSPLIVLILLFDVTSSSYYSEQLQKCIKSQRIIGGFCASILDRPFQALLFIKKDPECGGSIISNRWILTAGHCVVGVLEEDLSISVGCAKIGGRTAEYYEIEKNIVHENFSINSSTVGNDIALLRTSEPIKYSERVKPIKLNRVLPEAGDETIVSGFGVAAIKKYPQISEYLMSVDGEVIGADRCKSVMCEFHPDKIISKGSFCAGDLNGGKDSCQGDSGGPLTIGNVLAGIVSWGVKCAEKMTPGIYTDVSYYFDWIVKNTDGGVCENTTSDEDEILYEISEL